MTNRAETPIKYGHSVLIEQSDPKITFDFLHSRPPSIQSRKATSLPIAQGLAHQKRLEKIGWSTSVQGVAGGEEGEQIQDRQWPTKALARLSFSPEAPAHLSLRPTKLGMFQGPLLVRLGPWPEGDHP